MLNNLQNKCRYSCAIFYLIFLLIELNCSANKSIKTYNEQGKIKEIDIIENNAIKNRILFEYDTANNAIRIFKYIPNEKDPVNLITVNYNNASKLKFYSYKDITHEKSNTKKENWVESYFYDNNGNLNRIETSFKSSYSISKNKTALITTRYNFSAGKLNAVMISGGTFKKDMRLYYQKKYLSRIEYKFSSMNWKKNIFELNKHCNIFYTDNKPEKVENIITKSEFSKTEDISKFLNDENIDITLKKLNYSINYKNLLMDLENQ